ncbi:MAG: fluoride exporter [Blastococcus sp.]|nr:fluoride exporter [Blastococcus sp.]
MSIDPDLPPPGGPTATAAAFVAVGGAAGACARAGLAQLWPHHPGSWAWSTLVTNLVGSAAIAVVLVGLIRRRPEDRYLRPLLATGLLGGFTTYSAFAVDTAQLIRHDRPWLAIGYVTATTVGIVAVCTASLLVARRLVPDRP